MVTLDDPRARAAYEDPPEELQRMSFGDHLDELRTRLLRALVAVLVCVFGMLPFKDQVQAIVVEPYRILWRDAFEDHVAALEEMERTGALQHDEFAQTFLANCRKYGDVILAGEFKHAHILPQLTGFPIPYTLQALGGLDDFWTFMMASFVFAFVLASPVVIWQMWAFVAAGLYSKERRVFYAYFPFAMGLLASGVLFGYFFAVPYGLGFLVRMMKTDQVTAMLSVGQYFTLMFTLTAAMGLIFQLPLLMLALQRVGLVRHRTYTKNWRTIVLVLFVFAAVLTPPDPFSMMLMAGPTMLLYLLGLVLTWRGQRFEPPDLETIPVGDVDGDGDGADGGGARAGGRA